MSHLADELHPNDARMTAGREEHKYLLPTGAQALAAVLGQKLPPHRYRGVGENTLPGAWHYVTSIYFDTPARHLFQRAGDESHIKVRAKEYYDLHPGLTELATDPRQLVRHRRMLWLELKHKAGDHTGKERIGIPKAEVPAFFAELGRSASVNGPVLQRLAELCRALGEPLAADCLVNYRRLAWQHPDGDLRVTLDVNVAFYAPPADLWTRSWALVRESLGTPRGREEAAVIEVKSHAAVPAWLEEVLARFGAKRQRYSKFEQATRAVHG